MAEPNPNNQLIQLPNSRYTWDSQAAFANGAAGSAAALKLWAMEVREAARNADWWARFRRASRSSPVVYEKRPGERGGSEVVLRSSGVLGGPGKMGGQLFSALADFGQIPLRDQSIYLDVISQATGIERHANEMMGLMDGIKRQVPAQLGDWGGRYVSRHTDRTCLHKSGATSKMYQNSKTLATLVSADTPSWNGISVAAAIMSSNGGTQFKMGVDQNGQDYWNLMFAMPERLSRSVKTNALTQSIMLNAGVRGTDNPYFTGVIPAVDGNTIISRRIVNGKGQVSSGSPWLPLAFLGVADPYVSGGTNTVLQGGGRMYKSGVTNTPWFEDFPGYLFPWNEFQSLTHATSHWGTGTTVNGTANCFFALVVNPSNTGTADSGKIGMIAYTVPAGANTLVVVSRLATTGTTAINDATVGSVTGAGLLAGKFTENYEVGAMIIPCNAAGCPIGAFPGLGQDAVGFVRGDLWGDNFSQVVEGGMRGKNTYTGWTFGEDCYQDVDGTTPGIVVVTCAVEYPELNLPSVT